MSDDKVPKAVCDERTNAIMNEIENLSNNFNKFMNNHFIHFKNEMKEEMKELNKKVDNLQTKINKLEVKMWLIMGIAIASATAAVSLMVRKILEMI